MMTTLNRTLTARRREGFSLIEVLVVLIVISIILGFTLTRITSPIDSSKKMKDKADVRNAWVAAQSYYADNGQQYAAAGTMATYLSSQAGFTVNANTGTTGQSATGGVTVGEGEVWVGGNNSVLRISKAPSVAGGPTYFIEDVNGAVSSNIG